MWQDHGKGLFIMLYKNVNFEEKQQKGFRVKYTIFGYNYLKACTFMLSTRKIGHCPTFVNRSILISFNL